MAVLLEGLLGQVLRQSVGVGELILLQNFGLFAFKDLRLHADQSLDPLLPVFSDH